MYIFVYLPRNFLHLLLSQPKIWACFYFLFFLSVCALSLWKQVLNIFSQTIESNIHVSILGSLVLGFVPCPSSLYPFNGKYVLFLGFWTTNYNFLSYSASPGSPHLAAFQGQLHFAVLGGLFQLKSQLSQWNMNLSCLYVTLKISWIK